MTNVLIERQMKAKKYLQSFTSQGRPEIASKLSEVGYKHGADPPPQLSEGTNLARPCWWTSSF